MTTLIVGLDGGEAGERALSHARELAKLIGDCKLCLVYVIEWSPYTFQTPEENAVRHKRREDELDIAHGRIMNPAMAAVKADGLEAEGVVRHGDAAEILDKVAKDRGAEQIIVARASDGGMMSRLFGSVTAKLVMGAHVPVTVVG